jgi:hypothetical protein
MIRFMIGLVLSAWVFPTGLAQELPKPTYANSVLVSLEHGVQDSDEVDYVKANLPFGLYAWLSFSHTAYAVSLDWHAALSGADDGIQAFKTQVDALIAAAKAKNVRIHIVIVSGLSRQVNVYREAKIEDVRNGQWFNDNKLCSDAQIQDPAAMDEYIFGTLSRYARKLRANLEAKAKAALAYLKQRMDENPGTLIAVSGWGEAEMNFRRLNGQQSAQDYFADFSPFAVMEFRDWIQHAGLYDEATGPYKGQGYSGGGAKYWGPSGLTQFNADFGTTFATWDLRYFNWSLADDYDAVPEDSINPDPRIIPYSSYVHGGMMPSSGPDYIASGFDAPRVQQPGVPFYDLWHAFREFMVHVFIEDMARWAYEAGIDGQHWYSHQIPADYLFGTNPSMPIKGGRYYSSASPLWTADVASPGFGSVGATIYDIKFPASFARTTEYILPDISAMSSNWAIMEYDAETYPVGYAVPQSSVEFLLNQYLRIYSYNAHFLNFWRWIDSTGEHAIKGLNKEEALRRFLGLIRDKARSTDLGKIFAPPKVIDLTGEFRISSAGWPAVSALTPGVRLQVSGKIWTGESWEWKTWGDFRQFRVYRSTTPNFSADESHWIGTTADYVYTDSAAVYGSTYYYKWRAENATGVLGPASDEVMVVVTSANVAVLTIDKSALAFGAEQGRASTSGQKILIRNAGAAGTILNWGATANAGWISLNPQSGTGDGLLEVQVEAAGLAEGAYAGIITIQDPYAAGSPKTVDVNLTVYSAGGDSPPFGVFETPIAGSTLAASVAVTGWALDDIEVAKVEIKRSPHPTDPPGAVMPDGLVYVGDAVFVKGARPDVEQAYPATPHNNRAGWGYMLLTNFFPNGGNGDFTIYAFAIDSSGRRTRLGEKPVRLDNANSILPFGAIDTPAQGGTASGPAFVNFGWALTPPPNFIPLDGSTLWVWVDGVPLGHPVYNNYRVDIATLFPGYVNSNGAVGYYYLDTTPYANGTHTIVWSARDSAGNSAGIGSRYFEVQNSSLAAAVPSFESASGHLAVDLLTSPEVEVEELGRVVVRLRSSSGHRIVGWGANRDRDLPVGSTLNGERGVFSWIPGPGFLGRHVLHFAATDGTFRGAPVEVVVKIVPKKYRVRVRG